MAPDIQLHELSSSPSSKADLKDQDALKTTTIHITSSPDLTLRDSSFSQDLERTTTNESLIKDSSSTAAPTPFIVDKNFKITLVAIWLGNFLCALDGTIVSTTMSNIASELDQSHLVTWIAVSYLLTSTAFQPLYGKTSDILGRKTLLLAAQFLFGLGILLSGMSNNIQTLSIARAISGIGGAGVSALATIIISDVVPLTHRSIYSAWGSVVNSSSQMLGGPIGGVCIVTIGWRWMFFIQLPLIIICFGLTLSCEIKVDHIPDGPERFSKQNLKRIDFGGIITLNLIVSSIIFLLSAEISKLVHNFLIFVLISSIIGYIYVERYIAVEKIIDPKIIKGQIGAMGIINGVNSLSFYMILFITPLYLQLIQNIDVTKIGFYTMFCVVFSAIGAIIAGYIIRKFNQTEETTMVSGVLVSLVSFFIQVIGFGILYLIVTHTKPDNQGWVWKLVLILGLIIAGLGVGGFGPGVSIFVIGKAGRKDQASANTVVSLIRSLGNVLGISISLSIYTKKVSESLSKYFSNFNNDAGGKIFDILIKDSNYIHNGLDSKYVGDVLMLYKNALSISFYPIFALTTVALVVMVFFQRSVRKLLN